MKKLLLLFAFLFPLVVSPAIVTKSYLSPDGVTVQKLEDNRIALTNGINSADGGLLQDETVTADKLDANANPENRWNEAFNDFIFTGLLMPTSASLSTTTTLGTAYINGTRVLKDATTKTYTASRHTFVDLSSNGTYTYQEVAIDATEPSVTTDSIRLARVSTDGTTVIHVRDDRETQLTGILAVDTLKDTDGDTKIQTEESTDEDFLRFDTAGSERMLISDTGNVGIGETSPVYTLDVEGTINASVDIKLNGESIASYAEGVFTRNLTTSSGTQTVTGVGFTPKAVIFNASVASTTLYYCWGLQAEIGAGFAMFSDYGTSADTYKAGFEHTIFVRNQAANSQQGDITSYNSDGFVITWTKAGSPTGTLTVNFLALR